MRNGPENDQERLMTLSVESVLLSDFECLSGWTPGAPLSEEPCIGFSAVSYIAFLPMHRTDSDPELVDSAWTLNLTQKLQTT